MSERIEVPFKCNWDVEGSLFRKGNSLSRLFVNIGPLFGLNNDYVVSIVFN